MRTLSFNQDTDRTIRAE